MKRYEDSHSLRQCRQPFINASGCLNPDLGQLGHDGEAYRRWQVRMNRYRREDKSSRSNKTSHKKNHCRRGNSRGQHQSQGQASTHKIMASTHARRTVTSSLGLATTAESPPRPPLPLLPPPLASGTVLHINFTRCSYYRLVQRPAPISLDSCIACWVFAQHVVSHIRSTQRHSHTYFCEEPTGSFAACYEVSRRYAGDGCLRLARRSSQPRHGSLRFKRRSVGDGSPRFGRRSRQLRHYSGDRSLRLGRRSSQSRHGGLCTKRRPPQPRAAQ